MLIYLHNEWKPRIITILWLARHYSHINMVAGAGLVWWCTVQSALSSINCTERFLVLRQKQHSYEPNMCWKHFFIKSYHKIQLFVRPFNFKINIMENRKTHFLMAVIEWIFLYLIPFSNSLLPYIIKIVIFIHLNSQKLHLKYL